LVTLHKMIRYSFVTLTTYSIGMKYIKQHYELLLASAIFALIFILHYPFYKAIILMLEFIVVIEVVKMIAEFMEKKRLRLRYILDVFIIFLIRDVIILTTLEKKPYQDILFLLLVIFIFFLFRILAVQYSPTTFKKKKSLKNVVN